jgi:phage tail P2-like protein
MRSLSDVSLAEILPANLLADPFVAALVPVFNEEFRLLVSDTLKILLFEGLDEQPAAVLDELAWQLDVDFYDQNAALSVKRDLIESALYWHSVKGTPHAVERALTYAFGVATLEEWFNFGRTPCTFRVRTEGAQFPSLTRWLAVVRMINVTKRAAAILEVLQVEQSAQQTLTIGVAMQIGQHITLGSA